ncbi:MAG: helix-turn-helix transcriptional regulator [Oscillospiraceae bacterium]|nr:helix-turn-helix transcriptional regulator [Oscillospiraceae bacterium]
MSRFSDLLSDAVHDSGISISRLAAKCRLGRSAVSHAVAGDFLPTVDFVRSLCSVLPVTPEKQRLITETYMEEKLGAHYPAFKRITALISSLPSTHSDTNEVEQLIVDKTPVTKNDFSTADNRTDVTTMCMNVVLDEMLRDDPHIIITIPVSHEDLFTTLVQTINSVGGRIRIDHFGRLLSGSGFEANFDKIRTGLFFCTFSNIDYHSYYYYSNAGECEDFFPPYPYCVSSSRCSVFVNDSLTMGLMCPYQPLKRQMDEYFTLLMRKSKPFFTMIEPDDILYVHARNKGRFISSIGYMPCFSSMFSPDMMHSRLLDEYKTGKIELMHRHTDKAEAYHKYPSHNYFSADGLYEFARTGVLRGIPGEYLRTFPPGERIELLEELRSSNYDIIDSDSLSVSNIQITIPGERTVIICVSGSQSTFCCRIDEVFLADGFDSFIRSLGKVGYLLADDEKALVVDECIRIASQCVDI